MNKTIAVVGELVVGKGESATLRNRLLAGAGGLLAIRAFFSVISVARNVVLARLLGQEQFGVYAYAFSWFVLVGIAGLLGMDQRLVRDVAGYCAKSEWGRLRGLLRRATGAVSAASAVFAMLASLTAWLILRGQPGAGLLPTLFLAMALVPLIALTRVRQASMQGLHRVTLGTLPEQVVEPGLFLLLIALIYFRGTHTLTAAGAMGVTVASSLGAFCIGGVFLYRTLPAAVRKAVPINADLRIVRSALPLLFISGSSVLFGQADTLILGTLKGPAAVGIYSIAHKNADFLGVLLNIEGSAFASTVASLYALRDLARLQRLVTRLARWTLLAAAPVAIILIGFGRWVLWLYGPEFVQAQTTLTILTLSQLVNVALGAVGLLLVMTGHERDAAAAIAAGAGSNILASFALCPRWGAEGAAVAFAIGMVVWNVWMVVALRRRLGLDSTVLGVFSAAHR